MKKTLLFSLLLLFVTSPAFAATLISGATGNFTAAGTWKVSDATSLLDAENGSETVTTAYSGTRSSTFTPGAITIDGICLKVASRLGTTGTLSWELYNSTLAAAVAATEVTINMTDINAAGNGWYCSSFASVLLLAGNDYAVEVKTSSASQITVYRNATADNVARQLRTTTTAAPAVSDLLIVAGEWTAAATSSTYTVTMDETASTDYGAASTTLASISVNNIGVLTWGTAASTNYLLKLSGILAVYGGGTYNMGTTGTPMPSTSTAKLQLDNAADGDFRFMCTNGATCNLQGASMSFDRTLLAADASAAATALTVADSTGWVAGDQIVIASTTRTASQSELRTIDTVSGTTVNITAGLTSAHSGTSPTQAEVINLTRNVKVTSTTAGIVGSVNFDNTAMADIDWVEFSELGDNVNGERGVELETTTGSVSINRSSIYNIEEWGVYLDSAGGLDSITFSNNVLYNLNSAGTASANGVYLDAATSGTSISITSNIVIKTTAATSECFSFGDVGGTITGNTAVSCGRYGFAFFEGAAGGTISGNTGHSNPDAHFAFNGSGTSSGVTTVSSLTGWRGNSRGLYFTGGVAQNIIFDGGTFFGNTTNNVELDTACISCIFNNYTLNGDSTFSTTNGILFDAASSLNVKVSNSDFGTASGIKTAHTNDINFTTARDSNLTALRNTILASTTEVNNLSNLTSDSVLSSQKHDSIEDNYKVWKLFGTITTDTTIFNSTPSSMRITPSSATVKTKSVPYLIAVTDGGTATVSAKVRESVVGDGTDYNGNRTRLIVEQNDACGITANAVLAAATVASEGAFEILSGTTAAVTDNCILSIVVDCDGTTGWVNVDTFTAPTSQNTLDLDYVDASSLAAYGNNSSGGGGGSYTFAA